VRNIVEKHQLVQLLALVQLLNPKCILFYFSEMKINTELLIEMQIFWGYFSWRNVRIFVIEKNVGKIMITKFMKCVLLNFWRTQQIWILDDPYGHSSVLFFSIYWKCWSTSFHNFSDSLITSFRKINIRILF
jgi:hypothetical protein